MKRDELLTMHHDRTNHGRDGAPLDSEMCNCRALFDEYARNLRPDSCTH